MCVAAGSGVFYGVALRKESVDRNSESTLKRGGYAVALRKESVDRNMGQALNHLVFVSLSARRAWIEIVKSMSPMYLTLSSLSARRAWIEIALVETAHRAVYRRSPQGERG